VREWREGDKERWSWRGEIEVRRKNQRDKGDRERE